MCLVPFWFYKKDANTSFFDKIIESGCYYVYKTLLVKELLFKSWKAKY